MSVDDILQIEARIWVAKVAREHIFDLNFDSASSVGLRAEDLVSDDYTACQEFADRCRSDRALPRVIKVPSAALPGTDNVVIFGPQVVSPYDFEPISDIDLPAALVAEDSRPLHTLAEKVRYLGNTHVGLQAWERGEECSFEEPPTPLFTFDH